MTQVETDINPGDRYRVFASTGNCLSSEGVTLTLGLLDSHLYIQFEFWNRRDAEQMCRDLLIGVQRSGEWVEQDDDGWLHVPTGEIEIAPTTLIEHTLPDEPDPC